MNPTLFRAVAKRLTLIAVLALPAIAAHADSAPDTDFGIWYKATAEKKINSRLSVSGEAELRTRDDAGTIGRWNLVAKADYRLTPWLTASGSYTFIRDHHAPKVSLDADGAEKSIRSSYWGSRHRVVISFTGTVSAGDFRISLREGWQYTYRPGKSVPLLDCATDLMGETEAKGNGKNVLRSRLRVQYRPQGWRFTPYADAELYNNWGVEKVYYTAGTGFKIDSHNSLDAYYRFIAYNHSMAPTSANSHILGLAYKYTF